MTASALSACMQIHAGVWNRQKSHSLHLSNQAVAILRKRHHRGRGAATLRICNDGGLAALHGCHSGVGSAQVDTHNLRCTLGELLATRAHALPERSAPVAGLTFSARTFSRDAAMRCLRTALREATGVPRAACRLLSLFAFIVCMIEIADVARFVN